MSHSVKGKISACIYDRQKLVQRITEPTCDGDIAPPAFCSPEPACPGCGCERGSRLLVLGSELGPASELSMVSIAAVARELSAAGESATASLVNLASALNAASRELGIASDVAAVCLGEAA